jgi:hypothetical protein
MTARHDDLGPRTLGYPETTLPILPSLGAAPTWRINKPKFKDYIPEFMGRIGSDPFATLCVPMNDGLRNLDAYEALLAARCVKIAKRLNEYLDTAPDGW